jgi:hypothetical protein
VHITGPGSHGAGTDPDEEAGGDSVAALESAGLAPDAQEDCERPTPRARLLITLRPVSAADWYPAG